MSTVLGQIENNGMEKAKIMNFVTMVKDGLPIGKAMQYSGLSEDKVEEIIKNAEDAYQRRCGWQVLKTNDSLQFAVLTGYLTQRARREDNRFELVIPNREIQSIFATQIMDLFRENVKKDGEGVKRLCEALKNGDEKEIENQFGAYLRKIISLRTAEADTDFDAY